MVPVNEEVIKGQLKKLVRDSVEETLNGLLEQEAEKLTQEARYERSETQQGYRSLDGVKLIVGDKCLGMLEAVGEVFPDAKYQRCTVHFYRNVFSVRSVDKVAKIEEIW